MKRTLHELDTESNAQAEATELQADKIDPRYNVTPPADGLVVRVHTKVLDGYEPSQNRWRQIMQSALGRDNLWITASEHRALADGEVPQTLQQRLARFHLVDNTRGEPPMWKPSDIRELNMRLVDGELKGTVRLTNEDGDRGYEAQLRGKVEVEHGQVVRFDMVCLGDFWGEGRYTRNAPDGRFPLAISFSLADGTDIADKIPPQGSRGWIDGYLR